MNPNPLKTLSARKGATLIEVVIVVIIALVLLSILAGSCQGLKAVKSDDVHEEATRQAEEYVKLLKLPGASVTCMKWDTDGDGYVGCDYSFLQPNGTIGTGAIECAAGFNLQGYGNEGCRAPKPKLPAQPQ